MVPRGDDHRVPHVGHVLHSLVQHVALAVHPQAQVDHGPHLEGGVLQVVVLPVLQQLLHPAQDARRAPPAVRVQDLDGVDDGALGRARGHPGPQAGDVGPMVVMEVVVGQTLAEEAVADAGFPVTFFELGVVGVDPRVEDVEVCAQSLVVPDVIAVASAVAGDALEAPICHLIRFGVNRGDGRENNVRT